MGPELPEAVTPKIRRLDLYPDEWIAGQVVLSNAERGLYLTACLLIYSHGKSVAVDDLKAACRDHGHAFNHQLDRLIALGKLIETNGQISNKRCSKEIQKVLKRIANGPRNGIKGGRPRKENNELENQTGSSARNLNQQPINQQPVEGKGSVGSTDEPTGVPPLEIVAGTDVTEPEAPDLAKAVFDYGVKILSPAAGASAARSIVGKLRKHLGNGDVMKLLAEASDKSDPREYVMGAVRRIELEAEMRTVAQPPKPSDRERYLAWCRVNGNLTPMGVAGFG